MKTSGDPVKSSISVVKFAGIARKDRGLPVMTNRERLQKTYGFLRDKIVPQLRYSQSIYEDVLQSGLNTDAAWLDVGCGHHLLPTWRSEQEKKMFSRAGMVVGIDFDFPSLLKHENIVCKVQGLADKLPFKDDFFDAATANMVVEHLDNPKIQFAEINRVLKPGAQFIFHTPNETGYFAVIRRLVPGGVAKKLAGLLDGRSEDDVFEIQYKANREDKIKLLAQETNFDIEKIKFVSSDAVCAIVPPLAAIELFWIRLLMHRSLRRFRTNLIVILRKKADS